MKTFTRLSTNPPRGCVGGGGGTPGKVGGGEKFLLESANFPLSEGGMERSQLRNPPPPP